MRETFGLTSVGTTVSDTGAEDTRLDSAVSEGRGCSSCAGSSRCRSGVDGADVDRVFSSDT